MSLLCGLCICKNVHSSFKHWHQWKCRVAKNTSIFYHQQQPNVSQNKNVKASHILILIVRILYNVHNLCASYFINVLKGLD